MEESVLIKIAAICGKQTNEVRSFLEGYINTHNLDIQNKSAWRLSDVAGIFKGLGLKNNFNNLNLINQL